MAACFRNIFGGTAMWLLLFLSSTMGTIVMVTPTLPVIFLSPRLSRRLMDFLIKLWFILAVALYELMMDVKIVVKGTTSRQGTSSLILLNHPTRLDWLFFMSYMIRFSDIGQYRITLKEGLKRIPGAGWAMQCAGFLFLKRKWDLDKDHISNGVNYFSKVKALPQILLFPEGTDKCVYATARSHKFAEKMGYEKYEHVLHPRTTGFVHFVNEMKKAQIMDSILDVTVAYPYTKIQNELQTVQGNFPEEIHFYVKDHPIETVPESEEDLEEWCRQIWKEKEDRLDSFYRHKSFDFEEEGGESSKSNHRALSDDEVHKWLKGVIIFWGTFLLTTFVCLILFPMFQLFCAIGCFTYILIGFRHGGVDNVIYTAVRHHEGRDL